MPRSLLRLVGIFLACCSCSLPVVTEPIPDPTPTQAAAPHAALASGRSNAPWALGLTFSGDLVGTVSSTAPSQGTLSNECTGKNSLGNKAWSSTFLLPGPGAVKALIVLAPAYHGAGVYAAGVSAQVHDLDLSNVWQNREGDLVSWTIAPDEESGRIDATLTNLATLTKKLSVAGTWTCRT